VRCVHSALPTSVGLAATTLCPSDVPPTVKCPSWKLGIVPFFDRAVERVHIDMKDRGTRWQLLVMELVLGRAEDPHYYNFARRLVDPNLTEPGMV